MARASVVWLTREEIDYAHREAEIREAERRGREAPHVGGLTNRWLSFNDKTGMEQHRLGVRGELAFAKWAGLSWDPPKFRESDVAGYEVRATVALPGSDWRRLSLIVRWWDKPGRYVLVVQERVEDQAKYIVVGWYDSEEAKRDLWLRDPDGNGKAWFVPQGVLRPINL